MGLFFMVGGGMGLVLVLVLVEWSYRFSYSKYVFRCILLTALSSLFAVRCQYNLCLV
jgi:hypothetical protein